MVIGATEAEEVGRPSASGQTCVVFGNAGGTAPVDLVNVATGSGIENLQLKAGTINTATLAGDALANKLTGNDGDNTLRRLAGNDILQGGLGNARLPGGLGRDILTGGRGLDIFIFNAGDSPATASPRDLNDFQTGFDKIDLDFITGSGLVAYAEVAIGSKGFNAVLSAANGAMGDGMHSVVFVAGSTDGWLLWNTDGDLHTPDQAVRLVGQNSLAAFDGPISCRAGSGYWLDRRLTSMVDRQP